MKQFTLFWILASLATLGYSFQIEYHNFTVHRLVPLDKEATDLLHKHQNENPHGFDFWTGVTGVGKSVDVMVPPHQVHKFNELIDAGAFTSNIIIDNVQSVINAERGVKAAAGFNWNDYYDLETIYDWLRNLADTDERVTLIDAGTTYENRSILGVKVVFKTGNENRGVFLESNIHAREWISSAVNTFILNELLTSTDSVIREVADSHDWYVFPVVNPDGFVYTKTNDRLWRKTRTPYGICAGADPNRNWGYQFNNGGVSSNPCAETYCGPNAFSEKSTKALSDYILSIGKNLQAYIGFHSYSQLLLIPYGHSAAHVENYADLYRIGQKAVTSLSTRYNTKFDTGNIVDILYVASGGSMDWVKGTFQTPITYTYELRDTGLHGFVLPAAQIIPSGEEIIDSLVTIFQEFDKIL